MGKISAEAKKRYFDKIKEYKAATEQIVSREQSVLKTIGANGGDGAYKRLTLADERANLASYFLLMNRLSLALLGVKNEAFLNDARKSCYQSIIYLEEVVTNYIDAPFSDYSDHLETIEDVDDEQRYDLIRKIGFTIQSVEDGFGENSKWKWSFVELEGRFATVTKNLLNLKTLVAGLDPRVDGYEARLGHLELTKRLLQQSADRYREKYEISTERIDDFKIAIAYLAALRRLHILLGEAQQGELIKRKTDVWKQKMETDERRAEEHRGATSA